MSIKTAAVSIEKPAAIETKERREETSRMVVKEVKSTLQHGPDPTRGKKFPFTRLAGSLEGRDDKAPLLF